MRKSASLGYAMELVVVIAVGMALARVGFGNPAWSLPPNPRWVDVWWRLFYVVEPFMLGVALAGGAGLAMETLRRRSPPLWGWGRWTWSLACLGALTGIVLRTGQLFVYCLANNFTTPISQILEYLDDGLPSGFSPMPLLTLVPCLITLRLAGVARGTSPDGRELAGRAFAVVFVLWAGVSQVVVLPLL